MNIKFKNNEVTCKSCGKSLFVCEEDLIQIFAEQLDGLNFKCKNCGSINEVLVKECYCTLAVSKGEKIMDNRAIKFRIRFTRKSDSKVFTEHVSIEELITRNSNWYNMNLFDIASIDQFTGLLDKNGKEMYENDIIYYIDNEGGCGTGVMIYRQGNFIVKVDDKHFWRGIEDPRANEVIGNTFKGMKYEQ